MPLGAWCNVNIFGWTNCLKDAVFCTAHLGRYNLNCHFIGFWGVVIAAVNAVSQHSFRRHFLLFHRFNCRDQGVCIAVVGRLKFYLSDHNQNGFILLSSEYVSMSYAWNLVHMVAVCCLGSNGWKKKSNKAMRENGTYQAAEIIKETEQIVDGKLDDFCSW